LLKDTTGAFGGTGTHYVRCPTHCATLLMLLI